MQNEWNVEWNVEWNAEWNVEWNAEWNVPRMECSLSVKWNVLIELNVE